MSRCLDTGAGFLEVSSLADVGVLWAAMRRGVFPEKHGICEFTDLTLFLSAWPMFEPSPCLF